MAVIVGECRRCHETREIYSSTKWCRPCQAAYYRARRKSHPEQAKARDARDREKRGDYFRAKAREQYARITPEQRARKHETQRTWYQRNKAREYAKHKAWRKAHDFLFKFHQRNFHALKRGAVHIPFTVDQLRQRLSMWGNCCWLCRKPCRAIDHVKPISKGGAHALCNLRPICGSCNSKKRNTWPFPPLQRR